MSWYRRLQGLPLRTKLLVTLVGAGLFLLGGASIASFHYWHEEALAAAERQVRLAAESTRSAVEGALAAGRPAEAHRSLQKLVTRGAVQVARVYDSSGRVVLSSDRSERGRRPRAVWIPSSGELPREGVIRRSEDEQTVRAFLPMGVAGGDVFEVALTLDPLVGAAEQGVWLGLGLLLAAFHIGVVPTFECLLGQPEKGRRIGDVATANKLGAGAPGTVRWRGLLRLKTDTPA